MPASDEGGPVRSLYFFTHSLCLPCSTSLLRAQQRPETARAGWRSRSTKFWSPDRRICDFNSRLERIRAVSLDSATQLLFPHRLNNDIHIHTECFIENRLDAAQINRIEPSTVGGRDDNVDIASNCRFIPGDRADERGMRYAPRLERGPQLAERFQCTIARHAWNISGTSI
jgi:hypothetical protein